MDELNAIVVIPARDEAEQIAGCLRALAAQTVPPASFATVVVLDECRDRTADVAQRVADELGLSLTMLHGDGTGPGAARRLGMDHACERLLAAGRPQGLIACTDADSRPAGDWLERQLVRIAGGADAVAGLIELDGAEAAELGPMVLARRERDAAARLRRVRREDPTAGHHHFAGASLGVTAQAYRRVGGLAPLSSDEDAAFARRLSGHGLAVVRAAEVRVSTSARPVGRVTHGLSVDLAVARWFDRRRFVAGEFDPRSLRDAKGKTSVTVIIPTRECATTITGVLEDTVGPLARHGLVDELVVADAASVDGTAEVAARAGARVIQEDEIATHLGPTLGKGDAMWRALQVTGGDVVCFLDGDTGDPDPRHLQGLLGPLLTDPSVSLVKGAFDRPLHTGAGKLAHEGGRVTELMARPLINRHEPLLAGFSQPLAGEFAARRELLESLSFPVGYGVEIAVLIDALRECGLDGLAECELGTRQNRHQPLRALGEMAYAVLVAVEHRRDGRPADASCAGTGRYLRPWADGEVAAVAVAERPPIRKSAAVDARTLLAAPVA